MKIRKFNESHDEEIDTEYNDCGDREFISRRNKLSNYIDNQNYNNTLLQKVKIAFTQLSDEYPNYKLYPVIVGNKLEVRIYPSN